MPRTPDYYGYFTFTSAPLKNFDFSLSGVYTGKMVVPHFAGYIEKDRLEHTPNFMELNLKLNYTFVLNDHLKLQLMGECRICSTHSKKIWIEELYEIQSISMDLLNRELTLLELSFLIEEIDTYFKI